MTMLIAKSVLALGGLGLVVGLILAVAYARLAMKRAKNEAEIRSALPGFNCGVCGHPSCDAYATAIAAGRSEPTQCLVGGAVLVDRLADLLGLEIEPLAARIAVLRCQGGQAEAVEHYLYDGPKDCRSNYILLGGNKACRYGCLGMGHCVTVCPHKAIALGPNRLPVIDPKACTGCGICVKECPRAVLELIPKVQLIYLACKNLDRGKLVKEVCSKGCISCELCVKVCPEPNAIVMIESPLVPGGSLPVMNFQKCTSCGICRAKCPTDSFIDRIRVRPYAIISLSCDGCGECVKVCQLDAIQGEPGKKHVVLKDKCIGCGQCFGACPIRTITIAGALGYAKAI